MTSGGCCCGAIRYEADGPRSHETSCHCSTCRRTSGAPFVAWVTFPSAGVRVTRGDPVAFRSSPNAVRSFCGRCGTQLFFRQDALPDQTDVTIASLDDPEAIPPRDHTFVRSRLSWVRLADGLPEHSGTRPEPPLRP